jgi:hypothetical protein
MTQPTQIVLQSGLSAELCIARLRETTDEQHRTFFGLSGYRGSKPILSQIQGNNFKLQKRRYYRNDFAPNFYGAITSWGSSARIEGAFGPPRWTVIFSRFWIAFMVLVSVPVAIASFVRVQPSHPNDAYISVFVPLLLVASAFFAPKFGDWLGRNEKTFILQFLETTLQARREPSSPTLE